MQPKLLNNIHKVEAQRYGSTKNTFGDLANDNSEDKQDPEPLARITLYGSVAYIVTPKNRLFERSAAKSYAIGRTIQLYNKQTKAYKKLPHYTICSRSRDPIIVPEGTLLPIILKSSSLIPSTLTEEVLDSLFLISNPSVAISSENEVCQVSICKL